MKSLIYIGFIIIAASFTSLRVSAQSKTVKDLVGKWEDQQDTTMKGGLEFKDNADFILTMNGGQIKGVYQVDFEKSPATLTIKSNFNGMKRTLKGLLEFIDDNHLKCELFFNGKESSTFSDSNDTTTILTRVKQIE